MAILDSEKTTLAAAKAAASVNTVNGKTANSARLLSPNVLARLGNLELIAKTLVRGALTGLHRTPDFGFSQEFAEYRAYNQGDDPRLIDWNVYARTDRTFIKRFRGETNSQLMILLDTSASMGYSGEAQSDSNSNKSVFSKAARKNPFVKPEQQLSKIDYGKMLAASLAYLCSKQMDSMGLMLFDEDITEHRPATSRAGQFHAVLHLLDQAQAKNRTQMNVSFKRSMALTQKRGMVAVISDFYSDTQALLDAIRPMAVAGHDLILFQVMDAEELNPNYSQSVVLEDSETGESVEVSPDYMNQEYPERVRQHNAQVEEIARKSGADYVLLNTSEPLDRSLHRYLNFRQRRA